MPGHEMSYPVGPGIACIASHLPGEPIGNEGLVARHGFDEAFIRDKLGIHRRHFAAQNQYASDLATAAVESLIVRNDLDRASIPLLIVVTQTPDYCLPHVAALVQERTGLSTDLASFDLSLGCSGYVYGLSVVQSMMTAQGFERALLVTAETYSKLMSEDDRATAPLFGDGATATLLTREPIYVVGKGVFGTDGRGANDLIARGSAVRRDRQEPLFMDGRAIFNFVMTRIPGLIDRCLAANGLERQEIDVWVFHQASRYMLDALAPRIGVSKDRMLINIAETGNTTSSSIPLIIEHEVLSSGAKPRRMLLCGFGVGFSWGATVLTLHRKA
jgi:3-oxoacyl-[acyl-carrier-protein] synthase-3